MLVDYHVHPEYSIDAEGKILDYCRKAAEIGLKEICFTTHLDLDPVRKQSDRVRVNGILKDMRSDWPVYYFDEIEKARQIFSKRDLKIKAGVEVGYQKDIEQDIKQITTKYDFDFVIGSVHSIDHISISSSNESKRYFSGKTPEKVLKDYYEVVELAVESRLFDCIGHLDIYKRYGKKYMSFKKEHITFKNYIKDILNRMQTLNIVLEINTSPFRNGKNEPHPGYDILDMCREIGFNMVTVGSDCHRVEDLGRDVEKGFNIAREYEMEVVGFEKRNPYIL